MKETPRFQVLGSSLQLQTSRRLLKFNMILHKYRLYGYYGLLNYISVPIIPFQF